MFTKKSRKCRSLFAVVVPPPRCVVWEFVDYSYFLLIHTVPSTHPSFKVVIACGIPRMR